MWAPDGTRGPLRLERLPRVHTEEGPYPGVHGAVEGPGVLLKHRLPRDDSPEPEVEREKMVPGPTLLRRVHPP